MEYDKISFIPKNQGISTIKSSLQGNLRHMLIANRRPETELTDEEKKLTDKSVKKIKLNGAVKIKLYIGKHYKKRLQYGKIYKSIILSRI